MVFNCVLICVLVLLKIIFDISLEIVLITVLVINELFKFGNANVFVIIEFILFDKILVVGKTFTGNCGTGATSTGGGSLTLVSIFIE